VSEKIVNEEELLENIKRIYDSGHGYHTLKFPNGYVLKGRWDMSKCLQYFQIPDDLTGKTVLDIGPANGYFSFEMYKRGAKEVVALDVYDDCWSEDLNTLMNTKVKFIKKSITTIDESFGKFDIVFCSNMLQHHSDLPGNIERIKMLTKEMAILCIGIMGDSNNKVPLARFVGGPGGLGGGSYLGFYWKPNMKCFIDIAKFAGFSNVKEISTFTVDKEDKSEPYLGVIHCYI